MDYFIEVIKRYKKRLHEIEQYIEFISLQKTLFIEIKDNIKMTVYANKLKQIINSTVQYNAIIICLYGSFEDFIDEIALEYINILNSLCSTYSDLPKSIRNKHLYKVGEFLTNPQRYKGYKLTVDDCIKNLYKSINSFEDSMLNNELIIAHSGNLKIDKINDLFNDLGIKNLKNDIISTDSINLLDEFVEQRNTISHSWEVQQRYSFEKIKDELIVLLNDIGEKLKEILNDEIFLFKNKKTAIESFDTPHDIINNRVLCINSKNSYLQKGDFIIAKKNNDKKLMLKILDIQVNKNNVDSINEENIDVGILVNKNIKKNWKYFYFSRSSN